MNWLTLLDFLGTALGLLYLYLEYRANIWLWLVSLMMYGIDLWIYFDRGLYAKFGIALFSLCLVIYGWTSWGKQKRKLRIRHLTPRAVAASLAAFSVLWAVLFLLLSNYTDSRVPMYDSLAGALSIVALWQLSRKYTEQWLLWFMADAIYCALCFYKGVPFHGALYAFYTVMALIGYRKWLRMMNSKTEGGR